MKGIKKTAVILLVVLLACSMLFGGCGKSDPDPETVSYTITYELNGGTIEGEYKTSYNGGEEYTLPVPVRDGYEFLGWVDETSDGTQFTNKITKADSGDKTFDARWKKNGTPQVKKYTVQYELKYGDLSSTVDGKASVASAQIEEGKAFEGYLPKAVPENSFYKFDGWVVVADGEETKVDAGTLASDSLLGADGAITLVAKVVIRQCVIVYNLIDAVEREYSINNKGTFIEFKPYNEKEKLTVNKETTVAQNEILHGESFKDKLPKIDQKNCGWVYKTVSGGYVYLEEDMVFDASTAELSDGNLVLYACKTVYWIGPF